MWKEKLAQIAKEIELYGENLNEGATEEEIQLFTKKCRNELNIDLPDEYVNILKEINGLEFNGFILYGIDENILNSTPKQETTGLIESNKIWYDNEWQKQYAFLGESNISWYVYDLKTKNYLELDNPSGRIIQEYTKFGDLFEKILTDSLI